MTRRTRNQSRFGLLRDSRKATPETEFQNSASQRQRTPRPRQFVQAIHSQMMLVQLINNRRHSPCLAVLIAISVLCFSSPARAEDSNQSARTLVHLLDYIAQDYSGAVAHGKVVSEKEYAEMQEFSKTAIQLNSTLPVLSDRSEIEKQLRLVEKLVQSKADAGSVARLAREVKGKIIYLTKLQIAPANWPSLARGRELFQQNCSACHGVSGHGDGVSAATWNPKPSNFHDQQRMRALSPFQAFNTIRLGVSGTAMPAFNQLSDSDAWALAFYVVSLRYETDGRREKLKKAPLSLSNIASQSDEQIEERLTGSEAEKRHLLATIRLYAPEENFLALAVAQLESATDAYRNGNVDSAKNKALAAYLEGIEPIEPSLKASAPTLVAQLEQRMMTVRSAIEQRRPVEQVASSIQSARESIERAEKVLQDNPASPWLVFSMAADIVLREGFEAVLIIIAILGVLRAVGAKDASRWVHAGWLTAVDLGLVAWGLSDWLMKFSGLKRELMEGIISILAVVVLLYLGFWLHRRTEIGRWKAFIEGRVTSALNNRSLFGLSVISFLAVFREAVETVLFLSALSLKGGSTGESFMATGVITSFALVIGLAWLLVKCSTRLPIRTLFSASSFLMTGLAVILVGKGFHALQETGLLGVTVTPFQLRWELVGFYPTMETVIAQIAIIAVAVLLWLYSSKADGQTNVSNPVAP